MDLMKLLKTIQAEEKYKNFIKQIDGIDKHINIIDSAKPYLISSLYTEFNNPILLITARQNRARQLYDEISTWVNTGNIQLFPEPDSLPYERLASASATINRRLKVLSSLNHVGKYNSAKTLVITSLHALIQKTMDFETFTISTHELRPGMKVNMDEIIARWLNLGYEMVSVVQKPATVARHGGIVDIYSHSSRLPARIEFVGNTIESIRLFNPDSQRSLELVSSLNIIPARELIINNTGKKHVDLDLTNCTDEVKIRIEDELNKLATGQYFEDTEFYQSLYDNATLLDYLPERSLIIVDEPDIVQAEFIKINTQSMEMRTNLIERGELPVNFPSPYFLWDELRQKFPGFQRNMKIGTWGISEGIEVPFLPAPRFSGNIKPLIESMRDMIKKKKKITIVSQQSKRLLEIMNEEGIPIVFNDLKLQDGIVNLIHGSFFEGWVFNNNYYFLTDSEVFGISKKGSESKKNRSEHNLILSELSIGDYVVHIDHGIGRFAGITTMSSYNGGEKESLILEYSDNDKLYIPTDKIGLINKYIGASGEPPSLTRLGTQEWVRSKQKVKERAGDLAQELLDLYSNREIVEGFSFSSDSVWQQEMEASFPYIETADQLKAIQDVKEDMEKAKPMDRLICGDVGYGKTEIAIRAAFKAVMDGTQVAVLVPTTVLAQQHYATFRERLAAFPVRIDVLSRFRSDTEQQQIIDKLKNGLVDICIGTHRLLQKDVFFKNLGLLIVDEEQRFGVAHKEHLKKMRHEVDVLTMTATPIPRTLNMALTGVRDMSIMETPPEERLPVKTYVCEFDEKLIREAVLRELDRGGQVFFVHNRVENISYIAARLIQLIPEAKVLIGHGQMREEELESVMMDFSSGKSDILVCSTIIESGLDMPNVNTIIINQADKLGLYQLYQLRGRVGRGTNRAYAYFLYEKDKIISEIAQERLKTIFQANELGAGFHIAMKDMEIRGTGNLLGAEQSGHIATVGFDLYTRLLTEAIEEHRAKQQGKRIIKVEEKIKPTIEMPLASFLPEKYIDDVRTRLALYQRLSAMESIEEIDDLSKEMRDRFGKLPVEAENLIYTVKVKNLASRADIESINTDNGQLVIRSKKRINPIVTTYPGVKVGNNLLSFNIEYFNTRWQRELLKLLERIKV
ncbi:MAG: transcription-repair coupling factor [Chloroflexi bacterium]|nr:transcription-repair coupling factor [Chloroflexota bacterium]